MADVQFYVNSSSELVIILPEEHAAALGVENMEFTIPQEAIADIANEEYFK